MLAPAMLESPAALRKSSLLVASVMMCSVDFVRATDCGENLKAIQEVVRMPLGQVVDAVRLVPQEKFDVLWNAFNTKISTAENFMDILVR